MKTAIKITICGIIGLVMLGFLIVGCEDQSENIPTSWEGIAPLVEQGWTQYAAGDFTDAYQTFLEANQRNAFYLPAYNGLGWCAVRLTDFADAEIQFSFITTLANSADTAEVKLLADAYAGLCLSSTIKRSVLEISGEGSPEQLQSLAQESIQRASYVFNLVGESYASWEQNHDSLTSESLHLLNAQNYFYLQEFENSEAELSVVDPDFVPSQLSTYGTSVNDEIVSLHREVVDQDTSWYLTPANPGIHNYTEITPPALYYPLNYLQYQVIYSENSIQVFTPPEYEEIPFDWVEINPGRPGSLPGQDTGLDEDNQTLGPFSLGFSFTHYGNVYIAILLCTNGFASFTSTDSSSENQQIPNIAQPNNMIAPYWDDFCMGLSYGHGQCFYYYDAAENRFIAEWDSLAHADSSITGEYFTFELILYPNGDIDFLYKDIAPGTMTLFPSATVGKENAQGTDGVRVTFNGSGPLEPVSGTAIRVYRPLEFTVSYVYIDNFAGYLYDLIEYIEELIEF